MTLVVTSGVEHLLWFAVRPTAWPLLRPWWSCKCCLNYHFNYHSSRSNRTNW